MRVLVLVLVIAALLVPGGALAGQLPPPAGVTPILPIQRSQGTLSPSLDYTLTISGEMARLHVRNTGAEPTPPLVIVWVGLLDQARRLLAVQTFRIVEPLGAGETIEAEADATTVPAGARFYKIAYWEFLVAPSNPARVLVWSLRSPRAGGLSHATSDFTITFDLHPDGIGFELYNTGAAAIRLLWDECAYIDQAGRAHRVIHQGTRFIDRNSPLAPATVPPGSRLRDLFYPADYVTWTGRDWTQEPLYRHADDPRLTIGLFVVLAVGAKRQEHRFDFGASLTWPAEVLALFGQ